MKRKRFTAAAAALLLASQMYVGSAGAVPVDYDEPVPGVGETGFDVGLGNNDDGQTVETFVLDVGANTVSGNAFSEAGSAPDRLIDFDDMVLTVQPGQVLTSATFAWDLNSGTNAQTQFRLHDGPLDTDPDLSGLATVILGTASNMGATGMFLLTLPLGAGTYLLDQISIGLTGIAAADFDYTWTFNVEVVPLPPAVWLFLSGLVAMVGVSRRRSAT